MSCASTSVLAIADINCSSFYRPAAYAIAQTVVDIPLVLVQVLIFDLIVYFMSDLSRTPSQFFISLLFLWIITMTMYSFFRSLGALSGSLDVATRSSGIAIQALIVYTGYLIPPQKMHPWFKWLIWLVSLLDLIITLSVASRESRDMLYGYRLPRYDS